MRVLEQRRLPQAHYERGHMRQAAASIIICEKIYFWYLFYCQASSAGRRRAVTICWAAAHVRIGTRLCLHRVMMLIRAQLAGIATDIGPVSSQKD